MAYRLINTKVNKSGPVALYYNTDTKTYQIWVISKRGEQVLDFESKFKSKAVRYRESLPTQN